MRKIFLAAALIIFFIPVIVSAAEESSANSKLVQMERDTYGIEQNGAILNRINRLEQDYSGKSLQGNLNVRINSIYEILYGNIGAPSILAKTNAIEWNTYHEISGESISKRLAKLENELIGKTSNETFIKRIDALAQATFGTEQIPLAEMQIPNDVLIKVALVEGISSRTLQAGDIINFKVAENVLVNNKLIFAKGQRGQGTVDKVRKAKGWTGTNGKINIDFQNLNCIDGKNIEIYVGEESKNEMTLKEMISGAALVGMNLNDDWNKFMVHGKNIEIPAGTEFYIQTKKTVNLFALQLETADLNFTDEDMAG